MVIRTLSAFIQEHACKKILVAYSGGVDSQVLLHALHILRKQFEYELRAIHIHHGLQNDANVWVEHCQASCKQWEIPLIEEYITITDTKLTGIEAAARIKRYQAIAIRLRAGEYLMTGQHQNDQAETLLFNLVRGTGVAGMQGMQNCQAFSQGFLTRPLLSISRETILDYARSHNLQWIEDQSNQDTYFSRNYLRAEIIPLLTKRWPQAIGQLAKACEWAQEAQTVLDEMAENDYAMARGEKANTLSLAQLTTLSKTRQKNLLRYWFKRLELLPPSQVQLSEILEQLLLAREDKNPVVKWEKAEVRRYKGMIYALKSLQPFDNSQIILWDDTSKPLEVEGVGVVKYPFTKKPEAKVTVRFRQGGEKLELPGQKQRKMVKQVMQEKGIEPWLRERTPLLYFDDICVSILEENKNVRE